MTSSIPSTLAPFLQEYKIESLDPITAASLIIERTLQYGNRAEIRWLFSQYSRAEITDWFKRNAKSRLPEPHNSFWRILLEINE